MFSMADVALFQPFPTRPKRFVVTGDLVTPLHPGNYRRACAQFSGIMLSSLFACTILPSLKLMINLP